MDDDDKSSILVDEPHERQPSVTYKFSTLEEVQSCIEKYELETNSRFIQDRKDRAFGGHSFDLTNRNVRWQTRADSTYSVEVLFDGVPYFVVAEKRLRCEHSGKYKKRGVGKAKGGSPMVPQRGTKKTDCVAAIHVLQVLKFPSYHIPENTERRRRAASEQLRKDMFERGGQVVSEMWFYVSLPSADEHSGHDTSEYNTLSFRIDSRIIRRVHELVADGVQDVDEVKRRVDAFVRNELVPIDVASQHEASNLHAALICNRRYNPARSAIMHHIRYAKKQLQLGVNVATSSSLDSDDQDQSHSATPPSPSRPRRAKPARHPPTSFAPAPAPAPATDVYDLDTEDVAYHSSKQPDDTLLFADDDDGAKRESRGGAARKRPASSSTATRAKRASPAAANKLELDDVFCAVLRGRGADATASKTKAKAKARGRPKTNAKARNAPANVRTSAASSRQKATLRRRVGNGSSTRHWDVHTTSSESESDTDADTQSSRVVSNAPERTNASETVAKQIVQANNHVETGAETAAGCPVKAVTLANDIKLHDAATDADADAGRNGSVPSDSTDERATGAAAGNDRPEPQAADCATVA